MKLLHYGLKFHYRSTFKNNKDQSHYEEFGDLSFYLDKHPSEYPYAQDCSLTWHGQDIGFISNLNGNLTIRVGSSTFYFAPAILKDKTMRDILIGSVEQAKGFSKTEEMLKLLKR